MNKLLTKIFSQIMKFFTFEVDEFDILNSTEVLRRKNIIVNRLLMITNILITIFIVLYYEVMSLGSSISLLLPTIFINILISYFISNQKEDYEKQLMGMYLAVLSVSYIGLRLFFLYPQPYTYIFIYIGLIIVSLFQNRHAIILGDVLIFSVASFIHINEFYKSKNEISFIITDSENALHDVSVYTMFLLLFIFVITSMVYFSEYTDKERKSELKKRSELESEFENVLWNVFDTIEDFSQVTENDEMSSDYVSALMSKKLGYLLNYDEEKCDELFNFSIVIGVNNGLNLSYNEEEKQYLLKDYQKIRYKLGIGSMLLRRTRIRIKAEAMVRSRYESWFISENFKKIKSEDSSFENQIVLLCEIYIMLRDKQSFKKAFPHAKIIKEINDTFSHFFDEQVLTAFLENHVEFEVIYERTRGKI